MERWDGSVVGAAIMQGEREERATVIPRKCVDVVSSGGEEEMGMLNVLRRSEDWPAERCRDRFCWEG